MATISITPVQYKGYTIMEDFRNPYSNSPEYMFYPTKQGINHDADGDSEGWRYTGNCKWANFLQDAKDVIDELGYASHTDRVRRFKKFYYEYQNNGGSFPWKEFRNDNRFPH